MPAHQLGPGKARCAGALGVPDLDQEWLQPLDRRRPADQPRRSAAVGGRQGADPRRGPPRAAEHPLHVQREQQSLFTGGKPHSLTRPRKRPGDFGGPAPRTPGRHEPVGFANLAGRRSDLQFGPAVDPPCPAPLPAQMSSRSSGSRTSTTTAGNSPAREGGPWRRNGSRSRGGNCCPPSRRRCLIERLEEPVGGGCGGPTEPAVRLKAEVRDTEEVLVRIEGELDRGPDLGGGAIPGPGDLAAREAVQAVLEPKTGRPGRGCRWILRSWDAAHRLRVVNPRTSGRPRRHRPAARYRGLIMDSKNFFSDRLM